MRNRNLSPLAACAVLLAPASTAPAQTAQTVAFRTRQDDQPTRIMIRNFNFKAEASKVLTALAHLANMGIVTTQDLNTVVDAKLNDISVEDAVKLVAAQAKASYRHVGNVFVVAPDKDMPDILEKYGTTERIPLQNVLDPTKIKDVVEQIKAAIPFVTVRPAGKSVILIGAMEDLEKARAILQELDAPYTGEPQDSVSLSLSTLPVTDAQDILTKQFQLSAQKAGDHAIVFSGPHSKVLEAQKLLNDLDKSKEANARYAVYQVKYASPTSLVITLRQMVQNLTVVSGPTSYYIPLATLSFSNSNSLGGGGSGSNSGSSGSSSTGGSTSGSSSSGLGGGLGSSGSNGGGGAERIPEGAAVAAPAARIWSATAANGRAPSFWAARKRPSRPR